MHVPRLVRLDDGEQRLAGHVDEIRVPSATSVVPVIVGVRSFVVTTEPPVIEINGSTVSTVRRCTMRVGLPAVSAVSTTTRWGPSDIAAAVADHAPPDSTVAFSVSSATVIVTAEPGGTSAVPISVGVASLVRALAPPSIVTAGGVVSMVSDCVIVPGFPAGSVTLTVTVRVPGRRGGCDVVQVLPSCEYRCA